MAVCNGIPREVCKIHHCGQYIYAGCGDLAEVMRIAQWLRDGADPKAKPHLIEGGCWGLAVFEGKLYEVIGEYPTLCVVLEKWWAAGSGRDFALSAMAFGMTAIQSVKFASQFDVSTNNEVDEYVTVTKEDTK